MLYIRTESMSWIHLVDSVLDAITALYPRAHSTLQQEDGVDGGWDEQLGYGLRVRGYEVLISSGVRGYEVLVPGYEGMRF